jgi:tRNA threonylcarbamoyladenosine biosynthesis protein TsaE
VYELRLRSASEDDTKAIGRAVAGLLNVGDVVGLSGDLGAGKTRLVQGASAALGVEEPVVSPTFMLVREYDGKVPVNHVDAYRLHGPAELEDLGLDGVLDPDTVVFVEWADRVERVLPESWLEIRLHVRADDTRELRLVPHGPSWHDRKGDLASALAPFVVKAT